MTFLFDLTFKHFKRRYIENCGYGSGRAFTDSLVASVTRGNVFLDAGCGEGGLRKLIAPGVHYVGLDRYSGKQRNEYSDWNMRPNVLGDVQEIPLAASTLQNCRAYARLRAHSETGRGI